MSNPHNPPPPNHPPSDSQPIQDIPLDALHPHPANSNTMPDDRLAKLARHLQHTGRYPPLIVRPLPDHPGQFQLLDGHHRAKALRNINAPAARCIVWDVDDKQALLLLATLNRLEGRDDPHKRAALIAQLRTRAADDLNALASQLPETRPALENLLSLHRRPPSPAPAKPIESMPVAVQFFLLPDQRQRLHRCLRAHDPDRDRALMKMVDRLLQNDDQPAPGAQHAPH